MWKRILGVVMVLAFALLLPIAAAGCNGDDIKTQRHVEVKDQVVEQHTVVQ